MADGWASFRGTVVEYLAEDPAGYYVGGEFCGGLKEVCAALVAQQNEYSRKKRTSPTAGGEHQ